MTTGTLTMNATNNQLAFSLAGGVALAFSGKVENSGGTTFGGTLTLNQATADTEAFVMGVTLTSTAAAVAGSDQVSLQAMMEGVYSTGSASVSVNTTDQGKAYAGSISVNRMVDTTNAAMDSVTVTQARQHRADGEELGGGLLGRRRRRRHCRCEGRRRLDRIQPDRCPRPKAPRCSAPTGALRWLSSGVSTRCRGDLELNAIGVSVGVTTGQDSTAVAFTLGINILANSQSVFSGATAGAVLGRDRATRRSPASTTSRSLRPTIR